MPTAAGMPTAQICDRIPRGEAETTTRPEHTVPMVNKVDAAPAHVD